jgi:catechol 2,3-dioxygenase-like lactoylglutathione lyase family enzyme
MLDRVILTVSDLDRAVLFYRQALSFLAACRTWRRTHDFWRFMSLAGGSA